jgi:two-component system, chemotaxis family, protein-glutamate methylesterase/glutaminase
MPTARPTSVLVVDDSRIYRRLLVDVVSRIPGARVVGEAADGAEALAALANVNADLVLLDVEMPNMDGLTALREIARRHPRTGVVMVAGTNRRAADTTMKALDLGAMDFIPKPQTIGYEESHRALSIALSYVLDCVRLGTKRAAEPGAPPSTPAEAPSPVRRAAPRTPPKEVSLVLIGASTGGPRALSQVIPALETGLVAPVLVVQHMPAGFTKPFADQLSKKSPVEVREARDGEPAVAGVVLIAPGGRHMVVRAAEHRLSIGLDDSAPVRGCRPSVDVLFSSAADAAAGQVLSIVMTGMGTDGADGVRALQHGGGYCLAQDEATSTIFGMPRAVITSGLADEVLPLDAMARRINELAGGVTRSGRRS